MELLNNIAGIILVVAFIYIQVTIVKLPFRLAKRVLNGSTKPAARDWHAIGYRLGRLFKS